MSLVSLYSQTYFSPFEPFEKLTLLMDNILGLMVQSANGKTSHRVTQAGADSMLIPSPVKLAAVKQHAESPPIKELIASDEPLKLDVALVDRNNPTQVADFVEKHIIHATR